ncbi:MerR family transcriptional regulator [Aliirhizobium smilacinae]|uniref:MerR family transcriptional regulator n=1 Tax=Aliirhizobium smilacinae TaxID=1395944 RepID=UPI00319E9074
MVSETFSAKKVVQLTGLSSTMVDYLVRERFVTPSGSAVRGRGNARKFTFGDLVTFKVLARLLDSGVEIRRMAKGIRELQQALADPTHLTDKMRYLISDGRDVFLSEGETLENLTQSRQLAFAFLIDLAACANEIISARSNLPSLSLMKATSAN